MKHVTATIVNYGTPHLTRQAVWSLRSLYPDLPILVVDSGSPDDSVAQLRTLSEDVQPFTLDAVEANIHHGPGMDHALRRIDTPWGLTFDSDCIAFRRGFLEAMLARAEEKNAYMIGHRLAINDMGYPAEPDRPTYAYVHPKCALIRRLQYLDLPPFEKHGVPCLYNEKAAAEKGLPLVDFPVDDYVYHIGRGTARTYGYKLGLKGRLWQLRHWLRGR